jgi:hypothetical protein
MWGEQCCQALGPVRKKRVFLGSLGKEQPGVGTGETVALDAEVPPTQGKT